MTDITLYIGAPSHAVEPSLLAQQLPILTAALRGFYTVPDSQIVCSPTVPSQPMPVRVYAAKLGVQRDHITLDQLPVIDSKVRELLQTTMLHLAQDFADEGLIYSADIAGDALGVLSMQLSLPAAANFIGRDIANALPRSSDARVLRQFVNAAQMQLHQLPVADGAVNSVWCANELSTDDLSQTWLRGGLTVWWDALPAWDKALDQSQLNQASRLTLGFSDRTISLPLKRRTAWALPALWTKSLELSQVLSNAAFAAL